MRTKNTLQKNTSNNFLNGSAEKTCQESGMHCENCSGYEEKIQKFDQSEFSQEVGAMMKHDLLCEMLGFLGDNPESIDKAEKLFDAIKYQIAEYVVKYEFNCQNNLSVQLALWLEKKRNPHSIEMLHDVINQYLVSSERV